MNKIILKSLMAIAFAICVLLVKSTVYAENTFNYEINKKPLDISVESSGIKITLKEADYDGRFINISYEVDTGKDLGKFIYVGSIDSDIRIKAYENGKEYSVISGYGGSGTRRVQNNKYFGNFDTIISNSGNIYLNNEKIDYDIDLSTVYAQLHIDQIGYEDEKTDEFIYIDGEWNFPYIQLKSLGRSTHSINKSFEKDNAKLDIKAIQISPIQFSMIYTEDVKNTQYKSEDWTTTGISFEIKDNLGNIYESTGAHGTLINSPEADISTNTNLFKSIYNGDDEVFINECTFESIDKDANKIMIYPEVCFWRHVEKEDDEVPNVERKYITFDTIEIDLSNLE